MRNYFLIIFIFFASIARCDNKDLIEANNQFTFSFYLGKKDSSLLCFSPYSIFSCLSSLYIGSDGQTEQEMKAVLHLPCHDTVLSFDSLDLSSLTSLHIANRLWVDEKFSLLPSYVDSLKQLFHSDSLSLPFLQKKESMQIINAWINEKTNGKISHLIEENDLSDQTKLIATNTIYFEDLWLFPFRKELTNEELFYSKNGAQVEIPTMSQLHKFPYFENEEIQIVSLPFKNQNGEKKLSCILLLPSQNFSIEKLEQNLSFSRFSEWVEKLQPAKVYIKVPKFELSEKIELSSILSSMGMPTAFNCSANFSKIDGQNDLFISKVLHQSYFLFDEQGVIATAATAAIMNVTSCYDPERVVYNFFANHPFLFFIREDTTGLILFMGKLENPVKKSDFPR